VLTIGLPLVAALNAQQFAGVLAHEFGHFVQRRGMRLSYFVMSITNWLARVVYERDDWDYALSAASRGGKQGGLFLVCINLAVWTSRAVLWVLLLVGQTVGCALSRQMEFHADKYEAAISGSDAFRTTHHRLLDLNVACLTTYSALFHTFQESRQLPTDLPQYLASAISQLSAKEQADVHRELSESKTSLLSTHPSPRDRVHAITSASEPGIFHSTAPASTLFKDFASLCRLLTCMHYRQDLGLDVAEEHLIPTECWKPIQPPEPSPDFASTSL
jgi:Zn-dependent protease with chaperone function